LQACTAPRVRNWAQCTRCKSQGHAEWVRRAGVAHRPSQPPQKMTLVFAVLAMTLQQCSDRWRQFRLTVNDVSRQPALAGFVGALRVPPDRSDLLCRWRNSSFALPILISSCDAVLCSLILPRLMATVTATTTTTRPAWFSVLPSGLAADRGTAATAVTKATWVTQVRSRTLGVLHPSACQPWALAVLQAASAEQLARTAAHDIQECNGPRMEGHGLPFRPFVTSTKTAMTLVLSCDAVRLREAACCCGCTAFLSCLQWGDCLSQ